MFGGFGGPEVIVQERPMFGAFGGPEVVVEERIGGGFGFGGGFF